jgi:nitrite reductase/ring-hydroxylating ferredoxin subunit
MTWTPLHDVAPPSPGEMLGLQVAGRNVALYNVSGALYATDNICPHGMALLSDGYIDGDCVECPLHQALFDIKSGKVMSGPAETDIASYPVKLEGGTVFLDV